MKDKEDRLKEYLLHEAQQAGICERGFKQMSALESLTDLVGYYIKNSDWCLERNFPSPSLLNELTEAAGEMLEESGVFVNKVFEGEILNEKQVYIFHNCRGWIETGFNSQAAIIPMLYFDDRCNMLVRGVVRPSLLPIHLPLYVTEGATVDTVSTASTWFRIYKIKKYDDLSDSD